MLRTYALDDNGRLIDLELEDRAQTLRQALWIDLIDPTDEERDLVQGLSRRELPDAAEVEELEASSRSYIDENGLHLTSFFLVDQEDRARNISVAFLVANNCLVTLHERDLSSFRLLRLRARRDPALAQDAMTLLLNLFDTKVESLSDSLEWTYHNLERIAQTVLEDEDADLESAIDDLAEQEDINGKVRLCLMDTQRDLTFLLRRAKLDSDKAIQAREVLTDIDSLIPHNNYVFEKVNFLMEAAQGFISIEQNKIIKIFSIAAVVFLPPTLVASIYGMNFQVMPELDWTLGYPFALVLMILAGVAPYAYFKRKGWL